MRRRRIVGIGMIVVALFALGFSQLQAQSELTLEGLSGQISALSRRVSSLAYTKANKGELAALEDRVATLEARLGDATPISTATRQRPTLTPSPRPPTSTPTRPRPTSTPAQASITITRNMNVRRGPGTNYAVIRVAEKGEKFHVTGRNAAGDWWEVDLDGEAAWIYAPYVSAAGTENTRVVSTPTPMPRPTATAASSMTLAERTAILATALILYDQEAMGTRGEWMAQSESIKERAVTLASDLLWEASLYCGLSVDDTAILVGQYGTILDEVGYTARNGLPVRQVLMFALSNYAEAFPSRNKPCDEIFSAGVANILAEE